MNPAMVQKMTHANESGKPKIRGVAEENSVYPGHIRKTVMVIITMQKRILALRLVDRDLSG